MIFKVEIAFTAEEVIRLMLKGMEAEGVLDERKLPSASMSYNIKIPDADGRLVLQEQDDRGIPILVLTTVRRGNVD